MRITAGGPDDPSIDQINRIGDLTPKAIIEMSDEELRAHVDLLRRNRETAPPRNVKTTKPKANKIESDDEDSL